jgi:hypothetical protein
MPTAYFTSIFTAEPQSFEAEGEMGHVICRRRKYA